MYTTTRRKREREKETVSVVSWLRKRLRNKLYFMFLGAPLLLLLFFYITFFLLVRRRRNSLARRKESAMETIPLFFCWRIDQSFPGTGFDATWANIVVVCLSLLYKPDTNHAIHDIPFSFSFTLLPQKQNYSRERFHVGRFQTIPAGGLQQYHPIPCGHSKSYA